MEELEQAQGEITMDAPKRRNKLTIAIPSSLVSEYRNLREKTEVIGQVGRAAAIYRVDEIIIYPHKLDESMLIKYILGYMDTPQYLRRHLIKKRPELQYVGMLPPLRTPHHPTETRASMLKLDEVRVGVVTNALDKTYMVDIGVDQLIEVKGKPPQIGARVTVVVKELEPNLRGMPAKKSRLNQYWGYNLRGTRQRLSDLTHGPEWDLTIGTSKIGAPFTHVREEIEAKWKTSERTLIVFGSHKEGVHEIITREGKKAEDCFDYIVNTITEQGTETVRIEEAIHASLALLNTFKD
ncbi:MAG: RNA methyltransferase [Candidatus Bathyarchaeota archaeon]|nr:RNA methyltransferase [Candidatus Bathyarchaeota archaeon]